MAIFGKAKGEQGGVFRRRKSLDFDSADLDVLHNDIDKWVESARPKLGEILLDLGSIHPDELLEALQRQREAPSAENSSRLGEILLELGKIDETALAAALAHQFGIPLADLRTTTPDPEVIELVGEELARKHTVIPLRQEDGRVFLATADPLDTEAIEELTVHCKRIGLMVGARSEIQRLLDDSYNVLTQAQVHIQAFELTEGDDLANDDDDFGVDENAPIVQVVNRIITQGVRGGLIYDGREMTRYPAFQVEAVDSNGAGDVFHGAFVAARLRGMNALEAARFASAVSALKCTRLGAREGVPAWEDAMAFLHSRLDSAVSGYDSIATVYEDGVHEAEFP